MILTPRIRLRNLTLRLKHLTRMILLQPDLTPTNVLRTTSAATRLAAWNKRAVATDSPIAMTGRTKLAALPEHVALTISSAEAATASSLAVAVITYTIAQTRMTNLVANAAPMSSVVRVTASALKNARGVMAKITVRTHLTSKTVARVLPTVLAAILALEYNAPRSVTVCANVTAEKMRKAVKRVLTNATARV